MKLRQSLAELLAEHGVDTLFGVMGDGNMHFVLDAAESHGIHFVNARHETAAVLMADGYARASGRIAAATVTHGPGLAAAGLGLGVASAAHSPVLLIVGDVDRSQPLHVQAMDQETFAHALVSDVVSLRTARNARPTLVRMLDRLESGQGPVVLSVAIDVQEEDDGGEPGLPMPRALVAPTVPSPLALQALAERLERSRRPIVLAGRGALQAREPLIALAERCGALLATTIPARGLFAGHERDIGVMGGLSWPERRALFEEVDLVLAFGAGINRFTADHGRLAPRAEWIRIDNDPNPSPAQVPLALSVCADASATAEALRACWKGSAGDWPLAALAQAVPPAAPAARTPGTLDPRQVVEAVNESFPEDRAEVVGVGHFGGWPSMYSRIGREGMFVAPWDFGAIGVAVPTAIGVALARPGRMAVAWEGDGSLLASLGELETLARVGARVVVIVMDDGAYTAEVRKLRLQGRDAALACFGRRDLAGVARSLGLPAGTATDAESLRAALAEAKSAEGPYLVHVHLDPEVHQTVF